MTKKDILQIVLPRLSLIIAILALILSLFSNLLSLAYFLNGLLIALGLVLIMLIIGCFFGKYNITYKELGTIINFNFPCWKRILRLGHIPQLGEVKVILQYQYGDNKYWTFEKPGIWEDTGTALVNVNGCCERVLRYYQYKEGKMLPLGNIVSQPLVGKVILKIKLVQLQNDKVLAIFEIPLVFEEGALTERGFVPR